MVYGKFSPRCRVVTRVRVERGGITGVLDQEIAEKEENGKATDALAHAQTRAHTGITIQQHNKTRRLEVRVYEHVCI